MLTEDWVQVIKNVLSPSAFKDVALSALRALYARPVELTDGNGDEGVDAWIELPSGRVPVQCHAGHGDDWDTKLTRDVDKHALLRSTGRLFFLCAQTPTAASRQKVVAQLEARHAVVITVKDAREIASMAHDPEVLAALSRAAGLTPEARAARVPSPAVDARLAFTFFHEKSEDFRAEVARSVLSACLVDEGAPVAIDALLDQAVAAAGVDASSRWWLRRELEALVANGQVIAERGLVSASEAHRTLTRTALGIQALAADSLRDDCVRALEGRVHAPERRAAAVADVFEDLGLVLRESLAETLPGRSSDAVARRLNAVERRLADYLKPTGGNAAESVNALVGAASMSTYGRALAAAELFIQMTDRGTEQLASALGEQEGLVVWLDTSVALPMLCGKYDHVAGGWATSEIAVELHDALAARRIPAVIPSVYLEEMAAHLINAARYYRALIGVDADLARSENFYVAHFHAVAQRRGEPETRERFDELLQALGLPARWAAERDFPRLRRGIERHLEHLLKRYYGIAVHPVRSTEAVPLPEEPVRDPLVLKHDRCVARDLDERARGASVNESTVLCSQDRWLVRVLGESGALAIHPAVLLDVLQIVRPREETTRLASVRELAATFSEHAVQEGAVVWDTLAKLEGEKLADRELLRRAREFKDAWLHRKNTEERPQAEDWQRFKAGRAFER
jgi:hypothetical protein